MSNDQKINIVDYYIELDIDRSLDTAEIHKILSDVIGKFTKMKSESALNDQSLLIDITNYLNIAIQALPNFLNDTRRKKYDKKLKDAYDEGLIKINEKRESDIKNIYDKIIETFKLGNFSRVVELCLDAIKNQNIHDYRIYSILATAYFQINELTLSFQTIEDGLKTNPDNIELLKIGARQCVTGNIGYNYAQSYINRMMIVDPNHPSTVSEQAYLLLEMSRKDQAFELIDKYIEAHPSNETFRQNCAQDLIAHSLSYYTEIEPQRLVLASKQSYENCLAICNKAAAICNDKYTQEALKTVVEYGETEFNIDNITGIISTAVFGIFYCLTLVALPIGIILLYCSWRLYQESNRAYWQIYKYYLTGEREPAEKKYIRIGKFFTWYIIFTFKATLKIFEFIFLRFRW